MEDWKQNRLVDLLDKLIDYRGKTPKKVDCGIPLITAKIVKNGRIDTPTEFLPIEDYDTWMVRGLPQIGDIVLTTEAPLGEVAQLKDSKIALAQRIVCLRGKHNILDNTYLKYFLMSNIGQSRLRARESGTTVSGIKQSELKEVLIDYPNYDTQHRIASILSSLDDKISVNKKICENLEAQAQALFKHWFIDFAPFKDGKFVESELGMIPEGWRVGTLGEIAEFKRGRTITKSDTIEGEIPVVAGGLEPAYYHNKSNTSSRVITVSGSGANAGFTRMYFQPVWASDCSFVDNESTSYLHTAFCFLLVYKKKVDALKWGAAQPHVYAKDINKLSFAIPQIDVLSHFEELVTPFFDYMEKCKRESSRLSTLRDTLLPRLMSGEIKL